MDLYERKKTDKIAEDSAATRVIVERIETGIREIKAKDAEQDKRIGKLERKQSAMTGIGALLALFFGAAITLLAGWFGKGGAG